MELVLLGFPPLRLAALRAAAEPRTPERRAQRSASRIVSLRSAPAASIDGARPSDWSGRLQALPDDEVLERYFAAAEAKDRAACVQELFRRHYPKVVAWCLRFAGNRDEAYDLAQGIFAKAHRHLDAFRRDSKFTTWLYAIARSECLNHARAQKARRADVEDGLDDAAEIADEAGPGPHEALEKAATAREVRALLDRVLDETERRVFTLHFGEDVPLDAITRLLGLSNASGAKAYIVRARRKLERALRSTEGRGEALDLNDG